jgi:hypothetical protein
LLVIIDKSQYLIEKLMSLHRRLLSAVLLAIISLATSISIGFAETKEHYLTLDSDGSQSFASLVQQTLSADTLNLPT